MHYLLVEQTKYLSGKVTPPSSKSQSIRGLLLGLLTNGETALFNPLNSDDIEACMQVCLELGVSLSWTKDKLLIKSHGLPINTKATCIFTQNSGITTRFIMPLLGLRQNYNRAIVLDCGAQMRARPIQSLVTACINLGLNIKYLEAEGRLPVAISGLLEGGITEVDGITSQYLSALLLALPCALQNSEVRVKALHERPYMEMTLNWLNLYKINYHHQREADFDIFYIKGQQQYKPRQTTIAADFSSASYLIAAAAMLKGEVVLQNIDLQDPQGDKRLIDILKTMGANIQITKDELIIKGGNPLQGISIDANDIPDLLPTLAVIGTYAEGATKILNVRQARLKETDRIHSMTEGLRALGAQVEELADGMIIHKSKLSGSKVKGYDDHRTVMALAVAGMLAEGVTAIDTLEAINKTFPSFVAIMQSLGANLKAGGDKL